MKTASIKTNLIANLIGKAWTAAMNLAFVPLYIAWLGIEAYGLVGVYTLLITLFSVLDLGLSTTINRSLARLSTDPADAQEARDLTRTLESVYWGIGLVIGLCVVALAPAIAHNWVHVQGLSPAAVTQSVMLMGLVALVQWPVSLYMGGLMGVQRQVLLNAIMIGTATMQGLGALFILSQISATIQAFFVWQAVVYVVQSVLLAWCLWRVLPGRGLHARVRWHLWREHGAFAVGMTGISLLSIVLTQLDKVVLSTVLPLAVFGYYTLANLVVTSLTYVINPIFSALFPRFAQLAGNPYPDELVALYHKGCQLMALALVPAALTLSFYAPQLLALWVHDPAIVAQTQLLVRVLAIGTMLNGVMNLPFAAQLAYGWMRLSIYKNLLAVCVLVPLLLFMATRYGALGAALVWVVLNLSYVLLEIPVMHRRILVGEHVRWYLVDLVLPLGACFAVGLPLYLAYPVSASPVLSLAWIATAGAVMQVAAIIVLPTSREWLHRMLVRLAPRGRLQVKR